MRKILLVICALSACIGIQGQSFRNVLISNFNNPEEISISISPKDTNVMVAGANVTNGFYSHDGGNTWMTQSLADPYGVFGDPCLITDTGGNFLYFHLAKDPNIFQWPRYADRVILQKSTDAGVTWDTNSYTGYNLPKMQDKAWSAVDPATDYIAVSWTQFDDYANLSIADSSRILFAISKDKGQSWSQPVNLSTITGNCIDSSQTAEGAVPAFGLHGEIYVIWSRNDTLYMNRSTDYGTTWLNQERAIAAQPTGWAYNIAGLNRCNGLPVTLVDHSTSPERGAIYVNWTDKRNGPNDADVFLIKSTDGGNTWSQALRVNDDTAGKENFMSTMTIDQTNGDIYIIYYDRRDYNDVNTDVYLAYSYDGGNSFTNKKISQLPFYPESSQFFGDYMGVSAVNGCVRPAWMRMDNGSTSVWTALVNKSQLILTSLNTVPMENGFKLLSTNPTTSRCIVHYDGSEPFEVSIADLSGQVVYQKQNESETFYLRMDEIGLSSGSYLIHCQNKTEQKTFKLVLMK